MNQSSSLSKPSLISNLHCFSEFSLSFLIKNPSKKIYFKTVCLPTGQLISHGSLPETKPIIIKAQYFYILIHRVLY